MNHEDLNGMLRRAATGWPPSLPCSLQGEIMARVRGDDGRARRWRSFVLWLLLLAALSAMITACLIGWMRARQDTTHQQPPAMELFRERLPR